MDDKLTVKTAKFMSLKNLYTYNITDMIMSVAADKILPCTNKV